VREQHGEDDPADDEGLTHAITRIFGELYPHVDRLSLGDLVLAEHSVIVAGRMAQEDGRVYLADLWSRIWCALAAERKRRGFQILVELAQAADREEQGKVLN